jgi:uncharacterized DUF497 family protein
VKISYSDHAKKRMKQRGIEEWEIENIMEHPSYIIKWFEGRKIAVGKSRNRIIKIVFIDIDKYKKIITLV